MPKGTKYTDEFKREAVRLVVEGGKSAGQVGQDVGVAQTALSRWVRQHQAFGAPSKGKTDEQAELERLRRELRQVTLERDFLRDAAAYFAKHRA